MFNPSTGSERVRSSRINTLILDISHNWINTLVSPMVSGHQCTKCCHDNVPVSCDPDCGGDGHGQLPGQAWLQSDVVVLQQGPNEASQEHNHVEEAEPNESS